MKVIDPGHTYELAHLDGDDVTILRFVKRTGPNYPGNDGSREGTTMQEVLRAVLERCAYVNRQIPCAETKAAMEHIAEAIRLFEVRAARRHGRKLPTREQSLKWVPCVKCLHVGCHGECANGSR
jgi:hypothetical protein